MSARTAPVLVAVIGALAAGCASDRYVGSIGRDLTYSNRGYGFTVSLKDATIQKRWHAVDPQALDGEPTPVRPKILDAPIDLDGDGTLAVTETTRHLAPMLRLLSRTSTGAKIEIDVRILGGVAKTAPLDDLLNKTIAEVLGASGYGVNAEIPARVSSRRVGPDFEARIAVVDPVPMAGAAVPSPAFAVALIDHARFEAEEGVERRQVVRVVLSAPKLDDELLADHVAVLDAILLNRIAGTLGATERW